MKDTSLPFPVEEQRTPLSWVSEDDQAASWRVGWTFYSIAAGWSLLPHRSQRDSSAGQQGDEVVAAMRGV